METPVPTLTLPAVLYEPSTTSQELLREVDPEEFKRKMIAQVMQSTAGKNPLDFYLADLAVTCWMNHIEKTPEEFEQMLAGIPLPEIAQPDEGGIHIEGNILETPVIMVERPQSIDEEGEDIMAVDQ